MGDTQTAWWSVGGSGKLLLDLANIVILGSESCRTHDHILLSHDSKREREREREREVGKQ
jgi:hypothetical protein